MRVLKMANSACLSSRVKTFQNVVKRLHDARVFRNCVAHANWRSLDRSGDVRTRVTEKDGAVVFKKVRVTPPVLDAWFRRIERLDALLYAFVEESGDPARRRTRR
jgi:hypothetical protein